MAGICGIIVKEESEVVCDYSKSLQIMLDKLTSLKTQPIQSLICKNFYFGNATLISDLKNKNFIQSKELDIYCIIDGLVFVNDENKRIIAKKYNISSTLEDKLYIPYLYANYENEIINHITGWFNIFIFNKKFKKGLLINDRLGYLPLYYFETSSIFIFSSKIESLLASGLIASIEFDIVSMAEHLFFNYIISDHTYIRYINTLGHANLVQFDQNGLKNKTNYWAFSELLVAHASSKKEGIDLLNNGLKEALKKIYNYNRTSLTASLTGGFDGRVVLSYLMTYKNKLNLYSFGKKDSDDITIPKDIAIKENISYTPFLLDEQYLAKDFEVNSRNTIIKSNGSRNYKRSHYLYAHEQISGITDTTISGIFGDEVLKITRVKPNNVISKNSIDFISSDCDVELITQKFRADKLWNYLDFAQEHIQEFEQRMLLLKQNLSHYETINQKFYHFRFLINLRKYFGAEVNSYNDFCYNFSPFIDFDFLSVYFKSYFCGVYYIYNSHSLLLKRQALKLYGELVKRNYKQLLYYVTDRGYSMYDAYSFLGILKIITKYFSKTKKNTDTYNTKGTDSLFCDILIRDYLETDTLAVPLKRNALLKDKNSDIMSLFYWSTYITKNYINN